MNTILITDGLDKGAVQVLREKGFGIEEKHYEPEELAEAVMRVHAVVVRSSTKITKEIIDAALKTKMLRLIVRAGVGIDNIDAAYANKYGIAVRNTPGASTRAAAELTIGHIFALARKLYSANISMHNGQWEKKKLKGIELAGKTLGIIGLGRIGKETAKLAQALGMNIVYTSRSGRKEGVDEYTYMPLEALLGRADFISLHVPFDREKGALIGDEAFGMMKDGVYLINCARGGVVDEAALLGALESGKVAAAALDVFEEEPLRNAALYTHERVSLSPHIGGSTVEAQQKIGAEVAEILEAFFDGSRRPLRKIG